MPTTKPLRELSIDQHPKFKDLPFTTDNIILLRNNGYKQVEIARHYGKTRQLINHRLRRVGIGDLDVNIVARQIKQKESIKQILDNEHEKVSRVADKALSKLDKLLDNVDDDDIKAIVPVTAVRDRVFTQRRTLEDKSTGELDYKTINLSLTQITQEIKQYVKDNDMDVDTEVVE